MAEEGVYTFQLSLKRGQDLLNIRGNTFEVFIADVQLAKKSVDPEIARFFSENDTGLGAKQNTDLQQAANEVAKVSPSAQVQSITPNCTQCGGGTHAKTINLKAGGTKRVFQCNQDNGECLNEKGFPFTIWGSGNQKGRDS